jgi:hypothetical protein
MKTTNQKWDGAINRTTINSLYLLQTSYHLITLAAPRFSTRTDATTLERIWSRSIQPDAAATKAALRWTFCGSSDGGPWIIERLLAPRCCAHGMISSQHAPS